MEKLWAPWRMPYLKKGSSQKTDCVFCDIFKGNNDLEDFVVERRENCYAVLNIYPYNNGHLLILPNDHVADLSDMTREQREEFFDLMEDMKNLLKDVLNPDGFNIGINLGSAAGAGIPKHLHLHIVPRWNGDNNFMPAVGATKVIVQSLEELHKQLVELIHAKKTKS